MSFAQLQNAFVRDVAEPTASQTEPQVFHQGSFGGFSIGATAEEACEKFGMGLSQ